MRRLFSLVGDHAPRAHAPHRVRSLGTSIPISTMAGSSQIVDLDNTFVESFFYQWIEMVDHTLTHLNAGQDTNGRQVHFDDIECNFWGLYACQFLDWRLICEYMQTHIPNCPAEYLNIEWLQQRYINHQPLKILLYAKAYERITNASEFFNGFTPQPIDPDFEILELGPPSGPLLPNFDFEPVSEQEFRMQLFGDINNNV